MTDGQVTITYTPDQKLYGVSLATRNQRFRDRIIAAMVMTAKDVLNENKPEDWRGWERWTAAVEITQSPTSNVYIDKFTWFVATSPGYLRRVLHRRRRHLP